MEYPKQALIDGCKYPINTSYKIALNCFDIVNDDGISDAERTMAIIYLLFGFIPHDNIDKFLDIAIKYLGCGETQEEHHSRKRDMDFGQDWKFIVASFASDYHIDLSQTDMHFYHFMELIQGLTEHCALSRVREIRNYDLNDIKDAKTRAKIMESKESLKLKETITEDEKELLDEFESLCQ